MERVKRTISTSSCLLSVFLIMLPVSYGMCNDAATIKQRLQSETALTTIESVTELPFKDLYEVIANGKIYYIDKDISFMLSGELIDIKSRKNLTNVTRAKRQADALIKQASEQQINLSEVGQKVAATDKQDSTKAAQVERDSRGLLKIQSDSGCRARIAGREQSLQTLIRKNTPENGFQPFNQNLRNNKAEIVQPAKLENNESLTSLDKIRLMSDFISTRPTDSMIVYPAKGETKATITALVDVDCPHCQKLYADLEDYTNNGIEVRFMAFPLRGAQSDGARKLTAVWCADKPQESLAQAFRRRDPGKVPEGCAFDIRPHIKFGMDLKLRSTPLIITSTGNIVHGYASRQQIEQVMQRTEQLLASVK